MIYVIINISDESVIIMKKFVKNDNGFTCLNCGKYVEPLNYTSRDHCPYCLYSIHVDILPGDRLNNCLGMLIPCGIEKYKNSFKILYKCSKCNQNTKNIMANDDDMNEIIKISNIEK